MAKIISFIAALVLVFGLAFGWSPIVNTEIGTGIIGYIAAAFFIFVAIPAAIKFAFKQTIAIATAPTDFTGKPRYVDIERDYLGVEAEEKWAMLVRYDDKLIEAYNIALIRGRAAVTFLKKTYLSMNDKNILPNLIVDIKNRFPVLPIGNYLNLLSPSILEVRQQYYTQYQFEGRKYDSVESAEAARKLWQAENNVTENNLRLLESYARLGKL